MTALFVNVSDESGRRTEKLAVNTDGKAGVDLYVMTKAQLIEYAEANGITGVKSSMTKAQIIELIEG